MLLASLLLVAVGRLGRVAVDSARAGAVADAAALAGARSGRDAADDIAAANGARVTEYRTIGDDVVLSVQVGDATEGARARRTTSPSIGHGSGGLDPRLARALADLEARTGRRVRIVSGFRTRAEQQALWERRADNPYPVARPGTSRHETGLAIDVARGDVGYLAAVGPVVGICQPLARSDPIHFELC